MSAVAALAEAAGEIRASWRMRWSLGATAFVAAAFAPLLFGDARTVDLAAGLYLAAAAVGLALPAGIAGLPCLAQGAFVAVGAVVAAHLLAHGTPTALAAAAGGLAGTIAGAIVGVTFVRLPRAGFAVATWIVAWLVAFALGSLRWLLGGSEGTVISGGPSPSQHYELALGVTILAALGFAALARSPFGLGLAAARERGPAARALGVPTTRLRAATVAAAGGIAGVSGALSVQLAGVGDPASYGPYLSFKLFVIVLLGGGLAALGPPVGVVVLGVLSLLADALGSLEHVAAARAHELLAAVLLLGVVSLGWDGIVRPARPRRRATGAPVPPRATGRALVATRLGKRFGSLTAAEDVTLSVEPARITALVGPNGSGKTTVLRMLAGTVAPDAGRVDRPPGGVTRTLQATAVFPALTPLEHLLVAGASRRRRSGFTRSLFSTPQARAEDAAFVAEARRVLDEFGLGADSDKPASELPVSRQRLLMLAAASATGASILLVDEPTAGSSAGEAALVIAQLRRLRDDGLGLLVVEHNLGVVRSLADRVIVLDAGRVIADGTPDEVAADDAVRRAYLGSSRL
jgi:ABC-type branched-subunit amino acid transport system ATPase component/ABC-type branched-subunit amino acid transport system permease subunit